MAESTPNPAPSASAKEHAESTISTGTAQVRLPRVTITYCTQCKWLLRAAYYAQELLSTFSTSLGEVSLLPGTGGAFTVSILHAAEDVSAQETVLWDRKAEGGFPETKQLKALVRNTIDPSRDLGHVDRALNKKGGGDKGEERSSRSGEGGGVTTGNSKDVGAARTCEDC